MISPGAPAQAALAVDAEQVALDAGDLVENPWVTLGCPDLAEHRLGGVRLPVDRANVLLHQRSCPAYRARIVLVESLGCPTFEDLVHRLHQRVDRSPADLVPVDAALAGLAHRERAAGPDIAGVEVAVGLEDRHAPVTSAKLDRPVER